MTREECIALLDRYANYNGMGIPNLTGCKEAMKKAVELLSAKPCEDLEKAALGNYYGGGYIPKNQELREVALKTKEVQSFIAGAEWQASQMPMPEDTVLFNKGVAEGRRLEREDMLKDSVEAKVVDFSSYLPRPQVDILLDPNKYHSGDKVRIVVLKEEE